MWNERRRYQIGLVLTLLSGAAALSHQLLWTHRMTDLLGSSAESTTRVFSCFFLGLSVGAAVISLFVSRILRPWRALMIAEFGVAVLCLPALWLSHWTDWIWPWLGGAGLLGWQGAWIKLGLSLGVVFLPAFVMGTTLPLLVRGVGNRSVGSTPASVRLYASNTAGGLVGLAVTACFALYTFGVGGSMGVAIALNVVVGIVSFGVDRHSEARVPDTTQSTSAGKPPWVRRLSPSVLATAFASGFLILALEILAMDLVMLVAPLSFHAPVAVLGSFIFALAVSAAAVPVISKWVALTPRFLALVLIATAGATVLCPILFVRMAIESGGIPATDSVATFTGALVWLVIATLGPGLFLGGVVFPNLVRLIPKDCDESAALGGLLAINGIGGLLGAEVAYRLLLPFFGVYWGIGSIAVLYLLLALAWRAGSWKETRWQDALGYLVALSLVLGSFGWLKSLPVVNPNMGLKVLDLVFGREGNLAVVEHKSFGRGLLFSNQYLLGSTNVRYDQERQAHIPLLLHPDPKRVCFVGLATGITPSAALQHATVESIEVVELAAMVVDAAEEHFGEFNADIVRAPQSRIAIEDGRTFIAAHPDAFDVVISDLFLPWRPGVGRLYSVEHFAAVKKSLRSGGLFCQWLPLYQFTESQLKTVQDTFLHVFPKAYFFEGKLELGAPVLGMVGFHDGGLDWGTIQANCARERSRDQVLDPTVRDAKGLALLYRGVLDESQRGDAVNTLDNMSLELAAGLDRMTATDGGDYLVNQIWLKVSQRYIETIAASEAPGLDPRLPAQGRRISLLAARMGAEPAKRNELLKQAFELIPRELRSDRTADWTRWTGPEMQVRWKPKE